MKDAAELCRGLLRKAKSDRIAMEASLAAQGSGDVLEDLPILSGLPRRLNRLAHSLDLSFGIAECALFFGKAG